MCQVPEGWAVFVGEADPIVFAELEPATSCMFDWMAFDPVVIPANTAAARLQISSRRRG
jgi:hypothetical protein